MSWDHCIATFLNYALPQVRATRRTNLALLTVAILERRALAISVLAPVWRVQLPFPTIRVRNDCFAFCPTPALIPWRCRRHCWVPSVRRPSYEGWCRS